MPRRFRKPRKKTPPTEWQRSAEWRTIASAAIRAYNATRRSRPKCSATRKHDGERCTNVAMANGKCRCHGGLTPKGDDWHRLQAPKSGKRSAPRLLKWKLERLDRQAKQRRARQADMTAEEREQYERHRRSCAPGSAAEREARRHRRVADLEARRLLQERPETAPSAELVALREQVAAAERKVALFEQIAKKPIGAFE